MNILRRILFALFLTVFAASPALALTSAEREIVFHHSNLYVPPLLLNQYALAYGDSRTQNGGGASYASTAYSLLANYGNGYPGWLFPQSGNKLLAPQSWNYGIGGQTTAGIAGRLASTGNDCNNAAATFTAPCFTGAHTTTSGSTASGSSSIVVASATGILAGDYVNITGIPFTAKVAAGYVSGTTIPLTTPTTNVIATSQIIVFSHPSKSSNFAAFLGASNTGELAVDIDNNDSSTAVYSPQTDPAQVVFLLGGTNDANLTLTTSQFQPLTNLAAILDGFGPHGANKIVVIGDETPRGLANGWSIANSIYNGAPEIETVPASSPFTITAHNSATYYDTQSVIYAPAGTAAVGGFTPGANDGVALTAVGSSPASGQYSVAAGVYTFNSADSGKQVAINYRSTNNSGGWYLTVIHDWINSASCGSFTNSSLSPFDTFPISGAQCHRPWVHVAETWEAEVDGASGTNYFPLPFVSVDGLHPAPYGGQVIANAMLTAATAAHAIGSAVPYAAPVAAKNNAIFNATATNAVTAQTTTCPANSGGASSLNKNWFLSAITPSPITFPTYFVAGFPVFFPSSASGFTGATTGGTTITCVDTTNGVLQMSSGATALVGITSAVEQIDATSLISNGQISHTNTNVTAYAGCVVSTVNYCGTPSLGTTVTKGTPSGWSLGFTAGVTAALDAAQPMGVAYGIETNPLSDGYDDFALVLQGKAGTGAQSITLSTTVQASINAALVNTGDAHRATCEVIVAAGPNGRLWGVTGISVQYGDTTSGVFTPPGATANTYVSSNASQGGGSVDFTDPFVAGGPVTLDELSPPTYTTGMTVTPTGSLSVIIGATAGDLISATIRIRRCWGGKVTQ